MSEPSLKSFDWALVRSFLAVLDAGSLMGAARQLGMHQPTLSRHVSELETQLGAPLFERTGRGVTPTALAVALAEGARQMAAGAETLARTVARQRERTTGTVRITTSQVAATWLLPPVIAELRALEPGLQIELVASNQLTNLLRREADIAVRMVRPTQRSLVARRLGEVALGLYAHEDYLARHGVPRHVTDLQHHQLVGFDRDDAILRGFAAQGMSLAREAFAVRTDDQVAYAELVRHGAGLGFLAHYVARPWPGVRQVLPALAVPALPCWLAVHREIRGNPVVRKVYDALARALPARLAG